MQADVNRVRCTVLVFIFLDIILVTKGQYNVNFQGQSPRGGGLQNDPGPRNGAGPPSRREDLQKYSNLPVIGNPKYVIKSQNVHRRKERALRTFQGACRDDWVPAQMNGVQVCIYLNKKLLTWEDAKETCRKDYGFLLKLEGPVTVENENIQEYLQRKRIRTLWTGLHEEDETLVWDELAPHKVRPYNDFVESLVSAKRIWDWKVENDVDGDDICGELDLRGLPRLREDSEDDILLRKKRAPDDLTDFEQLMKDARKARRHNLSRNSRLSQLQNFQNSNKKKKKKRKQKRIKNRGNDAIALLRKHQARQEMRERFYSGIPEWLRNQQESPENSADVLSDFASLMSEVQDPPVKAERIKQQKGSDGTNSDNPQLTEHNNIPIEVALNSEMLSELLTEDPEITESQLPNVRNMEGKASTGAKDKTKDKDSVDVQDIAPIIHEVQGITTVPSVLSLTPKTAESVIKENLNVDTTTVIPEVIKATVPPQSVLQSAQGNSTDISTLPPEEPLNTMSSTTTSDKMSADRMVSPPPLPKVTVQTKDKEEAHDELPSHETVMKNNIIETTTVAVKSEGTTLSADVTLKSIKGDVLLPAKSDITLEISTPKDTNGDEKEDLTRESVLTKQLENVGEEVKDELIDVLKTDHKEISGVIKEIKENKADGITKDDLDTGTIEHLSDKNEGLAPTETATPIMSATIKMIHDNLNITDKMISVTIKPVATTDDYSAESGGESGKDDSSDSDDNDETPGITTNATSTDTPSTGNGTLRDMQNLIKGINITMNTLHESHLESEDSNEEHDSEDIDGSVSILNGSSIIALEIETSTEDKSTANMSIASTASNVLPSLTNATVNEEESIEVKNNDISSESLEAEENGKKASKHASTEASEETETNDLKNSKPINKINPSQNDSVDADETNDLLPHIKTTESKQSKSTGNTDVHGSDNEDLHSKDVSLDASSDDSRTDDDDVKFTDGKNGVRTNDNTTDVPLIASKDVRKIDDDNGKKSRKLNDETVKSEVEESSLDDDDDKIKDVSLIASGDASTMEDDNVKSKDKKSSKLDDSNVLSHVQKSGKMSDENVNSNDDGSSNLDDDDDKTNDSLIASEDASKIDDNNVNAKAKKPSKLNDDSGKSKIEEFSKWNDDNIESNDEESNKMDNDDDDKRTDISSIASEDASKMEDGDTSKDRKSNKKDDGYIKSKKKKSGKTRNNSVKSVDGKSRIATGRKDILVEAIDDNFVDSVDESLEGEDIRDKTSVEHDASTEDHETVYIDDDSKEKYKHHLKDKKSNHFDDDDNNINVTTEDNSNENDLLKLRKELKDNIRDVIDDKKDIDESLADISSMENEDENLPSEAASNNYERRLEDFEADDIEEFVPPADRIEHIDQFSRPRMGPIKRRLSMMRLSSCERRRPSICFSPPLLVEQQASTCPSGWYGHIFVDKCYKVIIDQMSFAAAIQRCEKEGGSLANMDNRNHEKLVLIAIKKSQSGGRIVGSDSTFWVRQPRNNNPCSALTTSGFLKVSCDTPAEVVCEKPARFQSFSGNSNEDDSDDSDEGDDETDDVEMKPFHINLSMNNANNTLQCSLKSSAKELPTIWFKDGKVVDIKVRQRSSSMVSLLGIVGRPVTPLPEPALTQSTSLELGPMLRKTLEYSNHQPVSSEMFQGVYWCEVWGTKPFRRHRSRPYMVKYSDVISFRGTIAIPGLNKQQRLLHNMIDKDYDVLNKIVSDLRTIHHLILPRLRQNVPKIESISVYSGKVEANDPTRMAFYTYVRTTDNYTMADEAISYMLLRRKMGEVMKKTNFLLRLPNRTPLHIVRSLDFVSTIACPTAFLKDKDTGFVATFKRSSINTDVESVQVCGGKALGKAKCKGGFDVGAYWDEISIPRECPVQTTESNESDQTTEVPDDVTEDVIFEKMTAEDRLKELAHMEMEDDNIEGIMEETADIVESVEDITGVDLEYIAEIMENTVNVPKLTQQVGMNILKTVDKVLDIDMDDIETANETAPRRILESFEKCAENVKLNDDGRIRLVQPNVVMEIWKIKSMTIPVIGLAAKGGKVEQVFKNERIFTLFNESTRYQDIDAAIELPKDLIQQSMKGDDTRLYMMVYRDGKLFRGAKARQNNRINVHSSEFGVLNSYIISASIAGRKIQGLQSKVKTVFKPLKAVGDKKRTCAFWDFEMNSRLGGWSSKGCVYDGQMNGLDVCLCDHLTNFAVLMDFYGQAEPIPKHHEFTLSIISLIGLSLSILGLSLTIISYLFFKKLRQGRAQHTLFNLSVAMLCSWVVFLTGIKQTHNYVACLLVAVLLHYFILSSFMWMLMEAFLQYLTFVKVLGTYVTRYTLKTGLIAWGFPMIPIITVLSIDYDLYRGGDRYCWMALPAFYYSFAIPIGLIVLCNLIVFVVTVISIFRRPTGLRSNQSKQKIALTNLQAAITSFVLLGLTWLLGYLAISDARLVFQYAFTILNSLQGFFIFVLFVARKKRVRDQWLIVCCCKTPQQEKATRSLSSSTSIPSTCSARSSYSGRTERSDSCKTTSSFINNDYESIYTLPYNRNGHDSLYYRKV